MSLLSLSSPLSQTIRLSTRHCFAGVQYLREAGAVSVEVYGDSELVIKQLNGQYECKSEALRSYYEECREILKSFPLVTLQHIPREHNEEANGLAQSASGYKESQ